MCLTPSTRTKYLSRRTCTTRTSESTRASRRNCKTSRFPTFPYQVPSSNEVLAESDARLKRNVADLNSESCLHAVCQLRPKSYEFIVNPHQQRFGVIAQELEQVLPSLVNTTNGTKAVNYVELIPFLIGSIQHLKQTVDCLQNEVVMMQSQLKCSG